MATTVENKELIDVLTEDLKKLKLKQHKLPARSPTVYKKSDGTFQAYAENLKNYFCVMSVPEEERSKLLLTFLNSDDFQTVTRVYSAEVLGAEEYGTVAERISHVLTQNISTAGACAKMMCIKQGDMSMQEFIKKLERLASIAFPEANMKAARDRCLISSLQANCRSKVLAYEIHNFIKSKTVPPEFNEVALKVSELDTILAEGSRSDDELNERHPINASVLQTKQDEPDKTGAAVNQRRCYTCDSTEHLKVNCPKNQARNRNFSNQTPRYNYNNNNTTGQPHYRPNYQAQYRPQYQAQYRPQQQYYNTGQRPRFNNRAPQYQNYGYMRPQGFGFNRPQNRNPFRTRQDWNSGRFNDNRGGRGNYGNRQGFGRQNYGRDRQFGTNNFQQRSFQRNGYQQNQNRFQQNRGNFEQNSQSQYNKRLPVSLINAGEQQINNKPFNPENHVLSEDSLNETCLQESTEPLL